MRAAQDSHMADRIIQRIDALAAISESPDALTRICFSPEHRRAGELILRWMREAGLTARMDEIGNVIGRYEGNAPGLPCLMLGSHSIRCATPANGTDAGRADARSNASRTSRGAACACRLRLEVVGFADEEGVRFSSTLLGSRAIAGTFDTGALEAKGSDGLAMREAMQAFGLEPGDHRKAAQEARRDSGLCRAAYRAGAGARSEDLPVGVVTAISGASRFLVELEGMAGHAGTVPMRLRRDALAGAAECVLAVERLCGDHAGACRHGRPDRRRARSDERHSRPGALHASTFAPPRTSAARTPYPP